MNHEELSVIGQGIPLRDSREKATGTACYLPDTYEKDMLWGKILRSPYAHARIRNIDFSRARRLAGVKAVIACPDTPQIKFGTTDHPDKLPLEGEKVRFVGDEVAAVAAVDEDTAAEALELIRVEYEPLPAVFDPLEAMAPGAPQIHSKERNISAALCRHFGDVEEGFRASDHVFEDRFTTQGVAHCCLEPHGCLARYIPPGRFEIQITTQNTYTAYLQLARALGVPPSQVSVSRAKIGGAFGGKLGIEPVDVICPLLAKSSGKTVKIVYSREEEFQATRFRHPAIIDLKTGVGADGRLIARQARIIYDNGAYDSHGPRILGSASGKFTALYGNAPHIKVEGFLVYTNNPYGGAFRGYGNPQITFAMESQMDRIAESLGIDAVDLHLKNALRPESTTTCGSKITSCGLSQCIQEASRLIDWTRRRKSQRPRGVGMAVMIHSAAGTKGLFSKENVSDAVVRMDPEGGAIVLSGACEIGQGSDTVLAQIAAEALGIRPDEVKVESSRMDVTPLDLGSYASRVTFMAGNAVKQAALKIRGELFKIAAELLEAHVSDLVVKGGRIFVRGSPDKGVPVAQAAAWAFRTRGKTLTERGFYRAQYASPDPKTGYGTYSMAFSFACHMAEVEVDPETGGVTVLRYVAAHDGGRIINPLMARGQIEGSVVQGIGFALTEDMRIKQGRVRGDQFMDYKIPLPLDIPPVEVVFVDTEDPNGPYGAKGLGEPGLVPVAPAIANAIYDAVGVRINDLPLTAEKIWRGLPEKGPLISKAPEKGK